jgi:hypothetical protein
MQHLVVEIAESDNLDADDIDERALRDAVEELRSAGAAIAVHGLGSHMTLNPRYVKLPCDVVATGEHATQFDAAIVADRIETPEQLDALAERGVQFGQGYALGCPTPALTELRGDVRAQIQQRARVGNTLTLAALVLEDAPAPTPVEGLGLSMPAAALLGDAARRAMARPADTRFDPIVVTAHDGAIRGVLSIERLIDALAR